MSTVSLTIGTDLFLIIGVPSTVIVYSSERNSQSEVYNVYIVGLPFRQDTVVKAEPLSVNSLPITSNSTKSAVVVIVHFIYPLSVLLVISSKISTLTILTSRTNFPVIVLLD